MRCNCSSINRLWTYPFLTVCAVLAFLVTQESRAFAQSRDTLANSNANEVLPSLQASADLELPDGRNITIHREAQVGQQRSRPIYFHRPLFAFVERPSGREEHPTIWDKVYYKESVYISMRLLLSTPEFRELARAAVIEEDPSIHVEIPAIQGRDVDVRAWPLKLLRMTARHSLIGDLEFGESFVEPLGTAGDQIEISIRIDAANYQNFLDALTAGRLEFFPAYTYSNAVVAFAEAATRISAEVSVAIDYTLASEQLAEGDPIFQQDQRRLENVLRQTIATTIRATDQTVLAHLRPQRISEQILEPVETSFDDIIGDNALLEKVGAYLAPIVREMQRSNEEAEETTKTDQRKDGKKVAIGWEEAGFAGDVELTEEQIRKLEETHSISFKESENRDVIEPHSIKIAYVRSGWQDNLVDMFQRVYLAVGRDTSFQSDSPVRAGFTQRLLTEAIGTNAVVVSRYSGFPKGVPALSFRADVPKGWVPLDGSTNWPDESWVPDYLRGQAVPDMRGTFARGQLLGEPLGVVNRQAKLTIPAVTVHGSGFSLKPNGQGAILNQAGSFQVWHRDTRGYPFVKYNDHIRIAAGLPNLPWSRGSDDIPDLIATMVPTFGGEVQGAYDIPVQNVDLSQPASQPPHAVGQWIMRVE